MSLEDEEEDPRRRILLAIFSNDETAFLTTKAYPKPIGAPPPMDFLTQLAKDRRLSMVCARGLRMHVFGREFVSAHLGMRGCKCVRRCVHDPIFHYLLAAVATTSWTSSDST